MDLIDRDVAIKALTPPESGKYKHVRQIIRGLTAVDAQPVRHGRWIRDEFGAKCGACGLYAYRDKFDQSWESPYCPNCGAKMGEENGTD